MLAKLLSALERKDTEKDGNWGYPSFKDEISEMTKAIYEQPAIKRHIYYTGKAL